MYIMGYLIISSLTNEKAEMYILKLSVFQFYQVTIISGVLGKTEGNVHV